MARCSPGTVLPRPGPAEPAGRHQPPHRPPEETRTVTGWIRHTPRRVVVPVLAVAAVLLAVGSLSHLTDLVRHGLYPYAWAPGLL